MARLHAFLTMVACALTASVVAQVEITYLGNEGVMLRSQDAAVLIDALHAPYKNYATASPEVRAQLEKGAPPYHDVDLVLVSHAHGDHFDAGMVARHLANNARARLVSAPQVVAAVRRLAPPEAVRRTQPTPATPGTTQSIRLSSSLHCTLLGMPHGGRSWSEMENLGHLVEIGGLTILHVGDAEVDPELFAKFRLREKQIDIALLPDWYLAYPEGQQLVREQIRPRHLFAVHVMDDSAAEATRRIARAFPDAVVLTKIGTTMTIDR